MKDLLKTLKLNEDTLSNALTLLVLVLVGVLIFNYFKSVNKTSRQQTTSANTEVTPEAQAKLNVSQVVGQGLPAEYTIKKGDSLWKIAQQAYGSGYAWTKIYAANKAGIKNPGVISEGTRITLPNVQVQKTEYTVAKGDNLWKIAKSTCGSGFVYQKIATDNNLANPRIIAPGQKLTIVCKF